MPSSTASTLDPSFGAYRDLKQNDIRHFHYVFIIEVERHFRPTGSEAFAGRSIIDDKSTDT